MKHVGKDESIIHLKVEHISAIYLLNIKLCSILVQVTY
jgi:hypothetical protein